MYRHCITSASQRRCHPSNVGPESPRRRRPLSRLIAVGLLMLGLLVGPSHPCGPGRGAGQRRGPRKMTPLVFKQHVPNVSEHTLGASGPAEGRIVRSDTRFKDLVVNNNPDIFFKDEEGTGADRVMSQRCRDKLNTLAVLVMNQWPGVRLRVTETWTEHTGTRPGSHASPYHSGAGSGAAGSGGSAVSTGGDSLHYEGRAVDVTTSDRDRTKYGMLARLAVEAGFDWVYYESRSHIHCSVKSDSSITASYGGCFPAQSTVKLESGQTITMETLSIGDRVLTFDPFTNRFRFDAVVAFMHRGRSAETETVYQTVETVSGHRLTLTPGHLIYASKRPDEEFTDVEPIFAGHLQVGNYVFVSTPAYAITGTTNVTDISGPTAVRVTKIKVYPTSSDRPDKVVHNGIYAPLTSTGNIVVDDVIASCYAAFGSHRVAHAAMTPLIYLRRFADFVDRHLISFPSSSIFDVSNCDDEKTTSPEVSHCTHWYAHALRTVTQAMGPRDLWYLGDV